MQHAQRVDRPVSTMTIRQSRLYWTGARRWRVRERGSREMNMKTCLQMST